MFLKLNDDFYDWGKGKEVFDHIFNLEGKVFRNHKNRRTFRITKDGRSYFIKTHKGTGWGEILKNLFHLRLPVLGAQNEVRAISRLEELGIATMKVTGFGVKGVPPAWLDSFVITEELENTISLEIFCRDWVSQPPALSLKTAIILKVADIARSLHQNGVNHRDFYICHFFLDHTSLHERSKYQHLKIYLIDLHRVQLRKKTPPRWIVKDLAGLFFSSMDIGLTSRDIFRFMKSYSAKSLRATLTEDRRFWLQVYRRAVKLYVKHFQRFPQIPRFL